jgi:hypothetical protein
MSSARNFVFILAFRSSFIPVSSQYHTLVSSIFTFRPRLDEDTYITSDPSQLARYENIVKEFPVKELPQGMLESRCVATGVLRRI